MQTYTYSCIYLTLYACVYLRTSVVLSSSMHTSAEEAWSKASAKRWDAPSSLLMKTWGKFGAKDSRVLCCWAP